MTLPYEIEKKIRNNLNAAVRHLNEAMTTAHQVWPDAMATAFISVESGNLQLYIARNEDSLEMVESNLTEHFWDAIIN